MSLLQTTEWDNESHSCTIRSKPAVRNWANVGWGHNAHSSSVWPKTAGLKPIERDPIRIQLRVDPTSNCDPRPSETVRMPPKCSATCYYAKRNDNFDVEQTTRNNKRIQYNTHNMLYKNTLLSSNVHCTFLLANFSNCMRNTHIYIIKWIHFQIIQ